MKTSPWDTCKAAPDCGEQLAVGESYWQQYVGCEAAEKHLPLWE